jgi:hypothetical protein
MVQRLSLIGTAGRRTYSLFAANRSVHPCMNIGPNRQANVDIRGRTALDKALKGLRFSGNSGHLELESDCNSIPQRQQRREEIFGCVERLV